MVIEQCLTICVAQREGWDIDVVAVAHATRYNFELLEDRKDPWVYYKAVRTSLIRGTRAEGTEGSRMRSYHCKSCKISLRPHHRLGNSMP